MSELHHTSISTRFLPSCTHIPDVAQTGASEHAMALSNEHQDIHTKQTMDVGLLSLQNSWTAAVCIRAEIEDHCRRLNLVLTFSLLQGKEQASLGHGGCQAQGFQGGRLAPCVGACQSDDAHTGWHPKIHRLWRLGLRLQLQFLREML